MQLKGCGEGGQRSPGPPRRSVPPSKSNGAPLQAGEGAELEHGKITAS